MSDRSLVEPLEIVEKKVESLETVPARISAVELQIVQLRQDMNAGFSAIRDDLRGEIRAVDERIRTDLRAEIRAGDEETRRFMRVLHEDVIARIAAIRHG
jgi:hypothetical protein